jgi:hypothetical protein
VVAQILRSGESRVDPGILARSSAGTTFGDPYAGSRHAQSPWRAQRRGITVIAGRVLLGAFVYDDPALRPCATLTYVREEQFDRAGHELERLGYRALSGANQDEGPPMLPMVYRVLSPVSDTMFTVHSQWITTFFLPISCGKKLWKKSFTAVRSLVFHRSSISFTLLCTFSIIGVL